MTPAGIAPLRCLDSPRRSVQISEFGIRNSENSNSGTAVLSRETQSLFPSSQSWLGPCARTLQQPKSVILLSATKAPASCLSLRGRCHPASAASRMTEGVSRPTPTPRPRRRGNPCGRPPPRLASPVLSLRTSDRCHWCGNPFSPSVPPRRGDLWSPALVPPACMIRGAMAASRPTRVDRSPP